VSVLVAGKETTRNGKKKHTRSYKTTIAPVEDAIIVLSCKMMTKCARTSLVDQVTTRALLLCMWVFDKRQRKVWL
jgi:hypothetical protein